MLGNNVQYRYNAELPTDPTAGAVIALAVHSRMGTASDRKSQVTNGRTIPIGGSASLPYESLIRPPRRRERVVPAVEQQIADQRAGELMRNTSRSGVHRLRNRQHNTRGSRSPGLIVIERLVCGETSLADIGRRDLEIGRADHANSSPPTISTLHVEKPAINSSGDRAKPFRNSIRQISSAKHSSSVNSVDEAVLPRHMLAGHMTIYQANFSTVHCNKAEEVEDGQLGRQRLAGVLACGCNNLSPRNSIAFPGYERLLSEMS